MNDIEKVIELFKHHELVKFIIPNCGEREYKTVEFTDVVEILEKQLDNGWVAVSERLPNKAGLYLVSNNMSIVQKLDIDDYHNETEIMYFSLKHKKFNTNSIVIAWQPLPEPYKEENHD